MEGVNNDFILAMAKRIGVNTQLTELALKLGLEMEDAEIFTTMNRMNGEVSTEGTRRMLCAWRNKTPVKKQWATLEAALIDADLAGIADEFSSKLEEKARKVPRSSMEIRSKLIRGAPDPDGDEEEPPYKLPKGVSQQQLEQNREELRQLKQKAKKRLEHLYTDPDRFEEETLLQKRDFQPGLKRKDSSAAFFYAMENSRHDIFLSPMARKHRRRIAVSGSNTAKLTALCHSLSYDWATQNRASGVLLEQQLVFELSANDMKPNQTIENAIKHQLFSDLDDVDEALIQQLLIDMPDGITILLDGFNDRNCGENIMDVLSGRTLQEVTVMVTTTEPRSANLLDRMAPDVYDRIDMY